MSEIKSAVAPTISTNSETAVAKAENLSFSNYIKSNVIQSRIESTLGDTAKAKTFVASLISAVGMNPELINCDFNTIISSALLGEALKLSPSPQLGQYYIVPFDNRKTGRTVASFQLGWKGYYQLALRSGQYKTIDAVAIKEGELVKYNAITKEIEFAPIEDEVTREKAKTIGYYAYFETVNGFKKELYWTKEKMLNHARTYSKAFNSDLEKGKRYSFWTKDFDAMALKTMLRQLISKYGIMSIDLQKAYTNDMTIQPPVTNSNEQPVYFDVDVQDGVIDENDNA